MLRKILVELGKCVKDQSCFLLRSPTSEKGRQLVLLYGLGQSPPHKLVFGVELSPRSIFTWFRAKPIPVLRSPMLGPSIVLSKLPITRSECARGVKKSHIRKRMTANWSRYMDLDNPPPLISQFLGLSQVLDLSLHFSLDITIFFPNIHQFNVVMVRNHELYSILFSQCIIQLSSFKSGLKLYIAKFESI